MDDARPPMASLTPADHALAHALTLYVTTVQPELGPKDSLGMVLRRAGRAGCGDNPFAIQLHKMTGALLRAASGSPERSRIDHELRAVLREFHAWRLRLALDRIEEGEKVNG